jgi:hypothetical protein
VIENKCCDKIKIKRIMLKFEFELVLYLYASLGGSFILYTITIEFIVGPAGPLRV